jgi:hypothetical protein
MRRKAKTRLNLHLPPSLLARIRELANADQRRTAEMARILIQRGIAAGETAPAVLHAPLDGTTPE